MWFIKFIHNAGPYHRRKQSLAAEVPYPGTSDWAARLLLGSPSFLRNHPLFLLTAASWPQKGVGWTRMVLRLTPATRLIQTKDFKNDQPKPTQSCLTPLLQAPGWPAPHYKLGNDHDLQRGQVDLGHELGPPGCSIRD